MKNVIICLCTDKFLNIILLLTPMLSVVPQVISKLCILFPISYHFFTCVGCKKFEILLFRASLCPSGAREQGKI